MPLTSVCNKRANSLARFRSLTLARNRKIIFVNLAHMTFNRVTIQNRNVTISFVPPFIRLYPLYNINCVCNSIREVTRQHKPQIEPASPLQDKISLLTYLSDSELFIAMFVMTFISFECLRELQIINSDCGKIFFFDSHAKSCFRIGTLPKVNRIISPILLSMTTRHEVESYEGSRCS